MKIIDANVVLRYLFKDNDELFQRAESIIENEDVYVPAEIFAEIVYVLEKVYKVRRSEIRDTLAKLGQYENITYANYSMFLTALNVYTKHRIDFADSLLVAYNRVDNAEIISFDKKLNRILNLST